MGEELYLEDMKRLYKTYRIIVTSFIVSNFNRVAGYSTLAKTHSIADDTFSPLGCDCMVMANGSKVHPGVAKNRSFQKAFVRSAITFNIPMYTIQNSLNTLSYTMRFMYAFYRLTARRKMRSRREEISWRDDILLFWILRHKSS